MKTGTAIVLVLLAVSVSVVKSQQSACGGVLFSAAVITSPGYPGFYPGGNVTCRWTLTAAIDRVVVVQFVNLDLSPNYATVRVFIGARQIAKYTGNVLPPPLTLQETAIVEFTSNKTALGHGFKLLFMSRALACGGMVAALGAVASPDYPKLYRNYATCYYTVIAEPGRNVELNFTVFDVEGDYNDQLKIYDEGQTLQQTYTGKLPTPFKVKLGSVAVLAFTSNSAIQGIGFQAAVAGYP